MRYLYQVDAVAAKAEKGLIVALFFLLLGLMLFNILCRNVFQVSYQKILEAAPVMVLWLTFAGASLALQQQRHIRLEVVLRFTSPGFRSAARRATHLFGMGITGLLAYASFDFVAGEVAIFGPWGWVSLIFPLFFVMACFRCLVLSIVPRGEAESPTQPTS